MSRPKWIVLLVVVAGAAAWLRAETLGARPLWYDEYYAVKTCYEAESALDVLRGDYLGKAEDYRGYGHPPLYFALACLSMSFGEERITLRLPSALAGVAAVVLLMLLGRAFFDARTGLVAGILAAVSVYHVNYSMDGRPYMLLVALGAGQWLALHAFLRGGGRWTLAALGACGLACLQTHHTGAIVQASIALVAIGWLVAVWRSPDLDAESRRERLRRGALVLALLVVLGLVHLRALLAFLAPVRAEGLEPEHSLRLSLRFFHELFARWSGAGSVSWLVDVAVVAGVFVVVRRRDASAGILVWLAAPLLTFALLPFPGFFDIRFVMAAQPAFFLVASAGIVGLGAGATWLLGRLGASPVAARHTGTAAVALLCTALLLAAGSAYATFRTTDYRCSDFPYKPEVLVKDAAFCRRHVLLNTLVPEDAWLLREQAGDAK